MTATEDPNGLREALARAEAAMRFARTEEAHERRRADDWRDRALAAEAENTRLKEGMEAMGDALKPFVAHYEPWMEGWQPYEYMGSHARITFRQFRAARSVLATIPPKENP